MGCGEWLAANQNRDGLRVSRQRDLLFSGSKLEAGFHLDPKRKITRIEKDGEKLVRWEFDGSVRVWDLETGGLLSRFQHKPPRGIFAMTLSPNAAHFMTGDDLPGEYEGREP
jgi:WD40 repeat protein